MKKTITHLGYTPLTLIALVLILFSSCAVVETLLVDIPIKLVP